MSSRYFELQARIERDRLIEDIARRVADSGFPLEQYLEFQFPNGDYLISEESFQANNSTWGSRIGGVLGAGAGALLGGGIGAIPGAAAGQWLGNKIGGWMGKGRDQASAGDLQYWNNRFQAAHKGLTDVVQGMEQALSQNKLKIDANTLTNVNKMLQGIHTTVGKFQGVLKKAAGGNAPTPTPTPPVPNPSPAPPQPQLTPDQAADQAVQQIIAVPAFAQAKANPAVAALKGQDAATAMNDPNMQQVVQQLMADPAIAPLVQNNFMDPNQATQAIVAKLLESRLRKGRPLNESARPRAWSGQRGYRRIDPKIWD